MAQYLLKPDWLLPKIPDGVSYEHGGMACCGLGPSFGALQRMGVGAFDTLLVTGLGPVGLGGVINGKYRGARVIAVDSQPWRKDRAQALGADFVIDPSDKDALQQIVDLTDGIGVDAAVDCSGAVAARRSAAATASESAGALRALRPLKRRSRLGVLDIVDMVLDMSDMRRRKCLRMGRMHGLLIAV